MSPIPAGSTNGLNTFFGFDEKILIFNRIFGKDIILSARTSVNALELLPRRVSFQVVDFSIGLRANSRIPSQTLISPHHQPVAAGLGQNLHVIDAPVLRIELVIWPDEAFDEPIF